AGFNDCKHAHLSLIQKANTGNISWKFYPDMPFHYPVPQKLSRNFVAFFYFDSSADLGELISKS
ncbi:MAG: hypothetical protein K2Y08_03595, partial [Alphaproteobacteria bacterium]|nr:hypothetical protein [Alphaproteobacteria bacterium]